MTASTSSLTRLRDPGDDHVYIDPEDAAMLADTSIWLPSGHKLYDSVRKPDGKSAPPSRTPSGHSSNQSRGKAAALDDDLDLKATTTESTA